MLRPSVHQDHRWSRGAAAASSSSSAEAPLAAAALAPLGVDTAGLTVELSACTICDKQDHRQLAAGLEGNGTILPLELMRKRVQGRKQFKCYSRTLNEKISMRIVKV